MNPNVRFNDAKRRLDSLLEQLASSEAAPEPPATPDATVRRSATAETSPAPEGDQAAVAPPFPEHEAAAAPRSPTQTTEALTRLIVGAAVLGLDALASRAGAWEQRAGVERGIPSADGSGVELSVRSPGGARFRHGLIGWIFETEAELRPKGNPLHWLRGVVGHLSGSVFSVVFDSLPRIGPQRAQSEPSDQDSARWVARGQFEEQRSKAFAAAALTDIVDTAIPYLASRPGVQTAIAQLVRSPAINDAIPVIVRSEGMQTALRELSASPAMSDAVTAIVRSEGMQTALRELASSPAMADAVTAIVHSPAMEAAVRHVVSTRAMNEAIETLAESPALVRLVTTQGSSIAGEVVEEVRERGVSGDIVLESFARKLLGRQPRAQLPPEQQGLVVTEPGRRR